MDGNPALFINQRVLKLIYRCHLTSPPWDVLRATETILAGTCLSAVPAPQRWHWPGETSEDTSCEEQCTKHIKTSQTYNKLLCSYIWHLACLNLKINTHTHHIYSAGPVLIFTTNSFRRPRHSFFPWEQVLPDQHHQHSRDPPARCCRLGDHRHFWRHVQTG